LNDLYLNYQNKTVFLTVHGMVFIILVSIFKELPLEELNKVNTVIRGCSLSCVEYDGDTFIIHYLGDDSHLPKQTQIISYAK
ncbi:MAG: histidine phosphatase family protein, partial [Coprobacillaceae bacterium]